MHIYRHHLRKRAVLSFLQGLVILLFLLLLIVGKLPRSANRAISYNPSAGHLLVQLVELPEPAEAELHAVTEWALYGDGRLIFPAKAGERFWQAHLSDNAIWHLLDVLINQDHVFSTTPPCTGISSVDDGMCLTVNANGQQKDVLLEDVPPSQGTSGSDTLEAFLLSYHPAQATLYGPNPDHDGDVDDEGGILQE